MLFYDAKGFTVNWQHVFCTKSENDISSYGLYQNWIPNRRIIKKIEAALTLKMYYYLYTDINCRCNEHTNVVILLSSFPFTKHCTFDLTPLSIHPINNVAINDQINAIGNILKIINLLTWRSIRALFIWIKIMRTVYQCKYQTKYIKLLMDYSAHAIATVSFWHIHVNIDGTVAWRACILHELCYIFDRLKYMRLTYFYTARIYQCRPTFLSNSCTRNKLKKGDYKMERTCFNNLIGK